MLLSKSSSENLLWLSLACEEVKSLGDSQQIDKKIKDLPEGLPKYVDNDTVILFVFIV